MAPIAPDPSLSTAQDFLRMVRGQRAGTVFEKALDTYLATITDHGFNASTFTARVVASTHAGLISSVLAALCALKGPLHGGAPGPVLDMLDEIGDAARAEAWFDDAFAKGTTLMGFGHRIYKVRDPRADVLKAAVATLPATAGRLAYASAVEQGAIAALRRHKPGRRLDTNVEYYTALLLEALEIPRSAFTALFAVGRTAGWCAHIFEQEKGGRIIRPQSNYVGPRPGLSPTSAFFTAEPRQVRARVPAASNTQTMMSPPPGVKRDGEVAAPEAAVGMGEQRLGAEQVAADGERRRARPVPGIGRRPAGRRRRSAVPKRSSSPLLGGLHRAAIDAQPDRRQTVDRRGCRTGRRRALRSSRSTCGSLGGG